MMGRAVAICVIPLPRLQGQTPSRMPRKVAVWSSSAWRPARVSATDVPADGPVSLFSVTR